MRRQLTQLAIAAAAAATMASAAEAKFKVSFAVDPTQPTARQSTRVTIRTDVVLPRDQRMNVIAVGPWRTQSGQGILDVRLVRTGPRAFSARLRFPYAGRWQLQVMSPAGSPPLPPITRHVKVRPPA